MLLSVLSLSLAMAAIATEGKDVVIVGGGLSGLTAAYRLKKAKPELQIKILEAREIHGGRAYSPNFKVADGQTDRFNLGGEWIGTEQQALSDILAELNIGTYETYNGGEVLVNHSGKFHRVPSSTWVPDEDDRKELIDRARQLDDFIKSVDLDSLDAATLEKYEKMSLDGWMKKQGFPSWVREEINYYTEEDVDGSVDKLSLAFFVHYTQAKESWTTFAEDFAGPLQARRINEGSQKLAEELLNKIGAGNLELECPVSKIRQSDDKIVLTCSNGRKFEARSVILAIPPVTATSIAFVPPLPVEQLKILQRFKPYRWSGETVVKAVLTYEKPFWREMGLSGSIYAESSHEGGMNLPAFFTADTTSAKGNAALVVFADVGGEHPEKHKDGIVAHLVNALGPEAGSYIDYQQQIWSTDPYIKGCVASFQPGQFDYKKFLANIRKPLGNIHWAGPETAEKNFGFLSGAIEAGNRAAKEVLEKTAPGAAPARNAAAPGVVGHVLGLVLCLF